MSPVLMAVETRAFLAVGAFFCRCWARIVHRWLIPLAASRPPITFPN